MSRILNVNNYHYRRGGSDVVYLDHGALMEELGWESAYFSMKHPKNFDTPWSKYFVDEIEFGHSYSLIRKLSMAGKVIYSREAQEKLARLLADFSPDIAHLHCIYHHLSPSILPTLHNAGVPVVMTAHDLKLACPAYKMLNSGGVCERCKEGSLLNVLRHRCLRDSASASAVVMLESMLHKRLKTYERYLSKILVPSRFFMAKFVEWGWPEDRFAYVPNYVDASRFRPNYEPGSYFLYFGRLAPEKGVATLIRAAVKAGVSLKIAGTGPVEAELKSLAEHLGGSIEFLGYRSGDSLHQLIRDCRAVVLPSEWYENAPMSVLESFALGKPVIGATIGGIPELVVDGVSGWHFESGDSDSLCDALSSAVSLSSEALCQFGRNSRVMVEENFSRLRYIDNISSVYSSLMVA